MLYFYLNLFHLFVVVQHMSSSAIYLNGRPFYWAFRLCVSLCANIYIASLKMTVEKMV